ncbi:MAG TPA: hypothetical protein VEQ35_08170 [Beijerinckia sp.]|jgi:hypothetical protein|nr:hypothetical protein [Beijerinckia sp.]
MELTPFEFVTSTKEGVTLLARDEPMFVQAFIPAEAIDDYFKLKDASQRERQALILSKLEAFGRIAAGKYSRGELHFRDVPGAVIALVRVSLFDIESSGYSLRDANPASL